MINFEDLLETFDKNTIDELIDLAYESINTNIKLIEEGLDEKNMGKIFRGCHSLKGLEFMGLKEIIKISKKLVKLSRNISYENLNIKKFEKNYIILKTEGELFRDWFKLYKST